MFSNILSVMKKPLLIVIIILVVILAWPAFKFFRWSFQDKKPLDIIILDKTVPNLEKINHKSLTWVLTYDRFVKSTGRSYSWKKDYFGWYPTRPLREKGAEQHSLKLPEVMNVTDSIDAIYYTDTYGVFMNDWYRGINRSRRSRLLYGGLRNTDYLYLVEMQRRNKLCILEYNAFDYPTGDLERYKTNERLGIGFNGWTGKYFSSLDTLSSEDFPIWMTAMYRKEHRQPWTFTKPGVVLVRDRNIIVLEEGSFLQNALPYIYTDTLNTAKYGVISKVPFDGWFDIIDPMETRVVSWFKLNTTPKADSILFENFLTNEFPAVITDPANERTFYFAGDFTANKIQFWTSRLFGIENLKSLHYSQKEDDTRRFFWLYYKPLVTGILTRYYDEIKEQ